MLLAERPHGPVYVWMYVCMCVCVCVYIYIYIYIYMVIERHEYERHSATLESDTVSTRPGTASEDTCSK